MMLLSMATTTTSRPQQPGQAREARVGQVVVRGLKHHQQTEHQDTHQDGRTHLVGELLVEADDLAGGLLQRQDAVTEGLADGLHEGADGVVEDPPKDTLEPVEDHPPYPAHAGGVLGALFDRRFRAGCVFRGGNLGTRGGIGRPVVGGPIAARRFLVPLLGRPEAVLAVSIVRLAALRVEPGPQRGAVERLVASFLRVLLGRRAAGGEREQGRHERAQQHGGAAWLRSPHGAHPTKRL
jgi:hypothetical protein